MDSDRRSSRHAGRGWPKVLPRQAVIDEIVPARSAYGWLLRAGKWRLAIYTTLCSVAISVMLTWTSLWLADNGKAMAPIESVRAWSLWTAVVVPALITPMIVLMLLHILGYVERALDVVNRMAATDALSGLMNRRSFVQAADRVLVEASQAGQRVGLVMIDIDHFKRINDTHGHPVGDAAIVHVASTLIGACSANDLVARMGGEEFVWLQPEADIQGATRSAEALRMRIADQADAAGPVEGLRVSAGVASTSEGFMTISELLSAADKRLYEAKGRGRNRVESGGALP